MPKKCPCYCGALRLADPTNAKKNAPYTIIIGIAAFLGIMKRHTLIILTALALATMVTSCKQEGPEIPVFLHLDKVSVLHPTDGTTAIYGDAFLTSEIDGVNIKCKFEGVDTTANLGTFLLPCTVPLLTDRSKIKEITIYPIVKQNGISGSHIWYRFYTPYVDSNIVVAPDSITNIGVQGTDGLWNIDVRYRTTQQMNILKTEWFEPVQLSVAFDSVVERVNDASMARSGNGFGRVHFTPTDTTMTFFIKDVLTETDPTADLYLEMDYWTDTKLDVGMQSHEALSNNTALAGCVTLYPNDHWQKIYINLGRTWGHFNYYKEFRVAFTLLNEGRKSGDVRIDNVKVLSF